MVGLSSDLDKATLMGQDLLEEDQTEFDLDLYMTLTINHIFY